jgi:hypothetical protein
MIVTKCQSFYIPYIARKCYTFALNAATKFKANFVAKLNQESQAKFQLSRIAPRSTTFISPTKKALEVTNKHRISLPDSHSNDIMADGILADAEEKTTFTSMCR